MPISYHPTNKKPRYWAGLDDNDKVIPNYLYDIFPKDHWRKYRKGHWKKYRKGHWEKYRINN
jgi:hypothetical protein